MKGRRHGAGAHGHARLPRPASPGPRGEYPFLRPEVRTP